MSHDTEKNPYPHDTPEWQLYENMIGARRAARAFAADAENYQIKAAAQREKEALFAAALEKITQAS